MSKRVLFTPFDTFSSFASLNGFNSFNASNAPGHEYVDKNANWSNDFKKIQAKKVSVGEGGSANTLVTVYYRPGMAQSPLMRGLSKDDQIYIRGHSLAGFDGIFAQSEHDESGKRVHPSKMNKDLFDLLYHDAEPGSRASKFSLTAQQVVTRLIESGMQPGFAGIIKCYNCHSAEGDPNFSTALENALADKNYNSCGVIGYKGALSSSYHDVGNGRHKSSTAGGRASANQVVIRAPSN